MLSPVEELTQTVHQKSKTKNEKKTVVILDTTFIFSGS